jgi:hypothetical protein
MLVNYRFWNKIRNCGDAIMAYILQDVLGVTPVRVDADVPHLLGAGSIFFLANEFSHVWGSGVLRPEHAAGVRVASENIHAVRGHRTLEALRNDRPELPDIPIGDPGIFVDYLLDDAQFRRLENKYKLAVVPHHRSVEAPEFKALRKQEDICVVDMRDASLRPVRQIQQSEIVVSQSLHGLIFASALNKPNVWIADDERNENWAFKFEDWFSTVDNPQPEPLPLDASPAALSDRAELRNLAIDRKALLASFPGKAVSMGDPKPFLDFRSSRRMGAALLRVDWLRRASPSGEPVAADPVIESREGRQLSDEVRRTVQEFFASWSEMPYVFLAPPEVRIDDRILNRLTQYLDRKPSVDALVAIPKSSLGDPSGAVLADSRKFGGVEVVQELRVLGGVLALRPSTIFNFRRRIWNAFY